MYTLEQLKQRFENKKIFLTGHTGFKGSWLLMILKELGAKVHGYALKAESPSFYNALNGDNLCESTIGDLMNFELLCKTVKNFQPDYIFHLAAQPLVRLSYEIPVDTFQINAIGTANVLETLKLIERPCQVVLITTDKVYHNYEWLYPYRENDRLGGYDPYSASKACAELVIDSYKNSFFNISQIQAHKKAIAVGRAGNVIGGGDWAKDRLLPDIIKAMAAHQEVTIRNPSSTRPWQHVIEPLNGYLLLAAKLAESPTDFSEAFNFGPVASDTLTVKAVTEQVVKAWPAGTYKVERDGGNLHEASKLTLDISKAMNKLGWRPMLNATKAIANTIDWYKAYLSTPDTIADYSRQQILEYFELITQTSV
ncbi:MAG TPA: CDP-glucose 4,6-dehydratase [Mucilaginibacter sp.]|jgi:CDP-glucose 4,6-dehydratase|nr:CDP-glucose 4,6-dehydratase [Mucilaginibacter sp.]